MALAPAVACALPAGADYEAGRQAWDAGRPDEALSQWRKAANVGDRRAMLALGRLYVRGLGAPQDYVLAHMWFHLAASRGELAAAKERDAIEAKLTSAERDEAQERARTWRPGTETAAAKRRGGATGGGAAGAREVPRRPRASRPPVLRPDAAPRAASAGDIDGLNGALAAGADVNARDGRGRTALMHAADKGYVPLVERLLSAKADPNLRGADGATALFVAAVHGHTEVVALLMEAGADVSIRGPKGMTAGDAAWKRYGDPDAARKNNEDPAVLALLDREQRERFAEKYPPGRRLRDCEGCPEVVVVPGGSYTMGSPWSEAGRDDDEGPVHRVTIGERFAVGVHEVTFDEWDACVRGGGCNGYRPGDREWGRGNRPVIHASWHDAQAYVRWLRRKTGAGYRLLSEAEWEYVARAGSRTSYHWGEDIGRNRANCRGCGSRWDDEGTAPVGSFPANGFGLRDVHGNVWEWVEDCWNEGYAGAPSDGGAWESGECGLRVLRGGSWSDKPRNLRSANRSGNAAGIRLFLNGFRVARTLTP